MKGYFLVMCVALAVIALSAGSPLQFEDGDVLSQPETSQALRIFRRSTKCDFNACDQLCRGLKFPGGACVGDKCDCDNF